jgi:glyoxylase-like metal-dependent hydrolase (beta-lactamase superfamily II)
MLLKHYFVEKIAHSSYILAGKEACAVIDPRRDVDLYIDEARALGVNITHILETHLHADFVSGHMDLARRTGAKIYAPRSGQCKFEHVALSEGDTIEIEAKILSGFSPEIRSLSAMWAAPTSFRTSLEIWPPSCLKACTRRF